MAKVLGVGGVFVKAADPVALATWYKDVLGFSIESWGGAMFPHPDVGKGVWSAFPETSDYFDPSPHPVMINLIVDDLDALLARAAGHGVTPLRRDGDSNGKFAWVVDPAGFKLELWEPAPKAP